MKASMHSLTSTEQAEFEALSRGLGIDAGYKWLSPAEYPTAIPASLREKFPSALLMWERTSSGCTQIVCNGIRLDAKANALDQEPFGVVVYSSGVSTGGVFIHHGSWDNRTVQITSEVTQTLESTGLGNYFPLGEVPSQSSGPLSDMSRTSHEGAFNAVISQLLPKSA